MIMFCSFIEAQEQFKRDQGLFSLSHGSHFLITRARQTMQTCEGAGELLKAFLNFMPEERPTIEQALEYDFFNRLEV